jgi:hypothetical protein
MITRPLGVQSIEEGATAVRADRTHAGTTAPVRAGQLRVSPLRRMAALVLSAARHFLHRAPDDDAVADYNRTHPVHLVARREARRTRHANRAKLAARRHLNGGAA